VTILSLDAHYRPHGLDRALPTHGCPPCLPRETWGFSGVATQHVDACGPRTKRAKCRQWALGSAPAPGIFEVAACVTAETWNSSGPASGEGIGGGAVEAVAGAIVALGSPGFGMASVVVDLVEGGGDAGVEGRR
jgi:hypothetical protein